MVLGGALLVERAGDGQRLDVILGGRQNLVGQHLHNLLHFALPALVVILGDQ
ncbi:hypothetical protein D3C84_1153940 [compost metagenome]